MNFLPYMLSRQYSLASSQIGVVSTVWGVISNILAAVGWGLLLVAIFGGRKQKAE